MKSVAVAFAFFAGLVAATPTGTNWGGCKPATYACDGECNWKVCNTGGQWVFAGTCPPHTVCKFDTQNGSPYCVPPNFQIP